MSSTRLEIGAVEMKLARRRLGYGVAVVINVLLLIVVHYILDWGWLAFLTPDFTEVVPWISLGLVATIMTNLVYQLNNTLVVESTGQILVNLIGVFATYQVYRVFPFDFSTYSFDWGLVARILLVLAMVGGGIGVLSEVVKLASGEPQQERR